MHFGCHKCDATEIRAYDVGALGNVNSVSLIVGFDVVSQYGKKMLLATQLTKVTGKINHGYI